MKTARDAIVIGASLGGLQVLRKLVGSLPVDLPAAVIVVQHTAPDSPKLLAGLIGRYSALPVAYAGEGDKVRPGHVYLAQPDLHLMIEPPGIFRLNAGPKVRHSRPAADPLFQSAAAVYGQRLVGVVLTGGDGDGTDGLKAIGEAGGVCVVQNPSNATDPSMPMSALNGDPPDYCVSADELAALLVALVYDLQPS
jgi:two-component system chemotaxis response regulator CheB